MLSNPAALSGAIVVGAVGRGAFVCGKRRALWKPMAVGGT
jgi:hypothetical protein